MPASTPRSLHKRKAPLGRILIDSIPYPCHVSPQRLRHPSHHPLNQPHRCPQIPRTLSISSMLLLQIFQTIAARVQSYKDWPHADISPTHLTKAGFFHAPSKNAPNCIKCFMCGRQWLDCDNESLNDETLHKPDHLWKEAWNEMRLMLRASSEGQ
jgi:hypothetical protein